MFYSPIASPVITMYTAFLALPPLEPQPSHTAEVETAATISETTVASAKTALGLWSSISYALDDAFQKLDSALPKNDAVKYVVIPSMFGGLGSVALQMVQDEGSFVAEPEVESKEESETFNDATAETPISTASNPLNNTKSEIQDHKHDFVPAIEMAAGLEFLILVISSVLLGSVVGFIGAVLSLDGPPEKANNKSKLAATALMFALFFPSVITVLQRNAESQTNQLKSEFQAEVQEITQEAEDNIQQAEDSVQQAAKSRIDETNETLNKVNESVDQVAADNPGQISQIEETTNYLIEEKSALIDDAKMLVLTATSEENARDFIESILEIGETDVEAVRDHAIDALEEIQESSELAETVQQTAMEKADELRSTESDDAR